MKQYVVAPGADASVIVLEIELRTFRLLAFALGASMVSVLISTPGFPAGLTPSVLHDSQGLKAADLQLMNGAIAQALDQRKDGAVSNWSNASSGRAGQVTILHIYQRGTAPCGRVQHVFTKGGGKSTVLPYCRQADGSWKIQF